MSIWKVGTLVLGLASAAPAVVLGGVNTWTADNLEGADTNDVAFDPTNDNIAYAVAGYGIYKSIDGGVNWSLLKDDLLNSSVAVEVNPANTQKIYVAVQGQGLLRSVDGGQSFQLFPRSSSDPGMYRLVVSHDGSTLYATSTGGVYRSTDDGVTWMQLGQGLPADPISGFMMPWAIAVDPTDANTLYVGYQFSDDGVFRSVDAGEHWTQVLTSPGLRVNDLAVDPALHTRVLTGVYDGVYVSDDSGANWTLTLGANPIAVVAADPVQSGVLYAGGFDDARVWKSTDGGTQWSRIDAGIVANTMRSITALPNAVVIGTSSNSFRSANGGAWIAGRGLRGNSPSAIAFGNRLYTGLRNGEVFVADPASHDWTAVNNAGLHSVGVLGSVVRGIVPGANAPTGIIVLDQYAGLSLSPDEGATWQRAPASFSPTNRNTDGGLVYDPVNAAIYAGTYGSGVWKSNDQGQTWSQASNGFDGHITALAISATSQQSTLYAGTFSAGVFRSRNGGVTWVSANGGLPIISSIQGLAADPANGDIAYVSNGSGVFRTANGGASWTAVLTNGQPSGSTTGLICPLPGTVFFSEYRVVYRSIDNGASWEALNAGPGSWFADSLLLEPGTRSLLRAGVQMRGMQSFQIGVDLALSGELTPSTVGINQQFQYQLRVLNVGPYKSTGYAVDQTMPTGVALDNVDGPGGTCTHTSAHFSCNYQRVFLGATNTITVTAHATASGTPSFQASVLGTEFDQNAANDQVTLTGLTVQQPSSPPPPGGGSGGGGGGGGATSPWSLLGLLVLAVRRLLRQYGSDDCPKSMVNCIA